MNKKQLTKIAQLLGLTEEEVSAIRQHSPNFIINTEAEYCAYEKKFIGIKEVTIRVQDTPEDSYYGTDIDVTSSVVNLIKALRK